MIGGAGTIGSAICRELFLRDPRVLHVVDISENNLVEVLMESMRSVTEDAIPEIEPAPEPDGDVVDEG